MKSLKTEFKSWFKPDASKIRKENYIGDKIIVEKDEIEEEEPEEHAGADGQAGEDPDGNPRPTAAKKPGKTSKLTELCDETTKEFKDHQKQMGIQNMESNILKKAKTDQKKVEENKKRFRNAIS